ncbi:MAG: FtsX-like permease family protein [Verrucomicrobia bacterium]|nr:FtsX-like permease family protein [Verrucomicrobiota bacterium]
MILARLVLKSLRQHLLSTAVTAGATALATGLLLAVWMVRDQAQAAFTGMTGGVDAVLGARGSKLQLVLNSLFHVDTSPGNLKWEDYEEIARHPAVALALPVAVGDNYRGFRIVGTLPEKLAELEWTSGQRLTVRPPGRMFEPTLREAVVGSFAAAKLGLKRGDVFQPYHGLNYTPQSYQHEEEYVVVGILAPSNTPADRVIWIPLAGLQKMGGHDPAAADEISAVLLKFKADNPLTARQLDSLYNKQGNRLTFAWPIAQVVAQLFDRLAWLDRVLALVAYLVVAIAAGSILASIYNSMNERRREIAILRALGARRRTVFGAVVLESAAIAGIGAMIGFAVYAAVFGIAGSILRAQTGVVLDPLAWHPVLVLAPLGIVALGALAGVVPAWKAYRTDVADNLTPHS